MRKDKETLNLPSHFPFVTRIVKLTPTHERLHQHECLEMTYILQGQGIYYLSDNAFNIRPGDLILSNNTEMHFSYSKSSNTPCIQQLYYFDPSLIAGHFKNLAHMKALEVFFRKDKIFYVGTKEAPQNKTIVENLYLMVNACKHKKPGYELIVNGALCVVLGSISTDFPAIKASTSYENLRSIQRLLPSITFINNNLSDPIRLKDAAKTVHLNPSYFSRLFSSTLKCTFKEYVIRARLNKAKSLLKHTDMNILDIAIECGFNNEANFFRRFRQYNNITPSRYRESR